MLLNILLKCVPLCLLFLNVPHMSLFERAYCGDPLGMWRRFILRRCFDIHLSLALLLLFFSVLLNLGWDSNPWF